MRGLPVVGPDIKVWANDMRRYLGRQLDRLSWRVTGQTASENGMILWDEAKGYPVASKNGKFVPIILEDAVPYDELLALGLIDNAYAVEKFGRNLDVDVSTTPEDIWNGGGVYTGFVVGAEVASEVLSSDAGDTGTVYIRGLRTPTSLEYETASYTLTGTTPVSVGSWWRANQAWYDSGDNSTYNIGEITVRHTATPANVFIFMPIGQSQTTIACWTVPFGSIALLRQLSTEVSRSSASATAQGALWTREINESPRNQFQFVRGNQVPSDAFSPASPVVLLAQTDIAVQITATSANNIEVFSRFSLAVYKGY